MVQKQRMYNIGNKVQAIKLSKEILAHIPHRRQSLVGRGSNLYSDFTIDYEQTLAFCKANGDYLQKRQWKDLTVKVYMI